MHTVTQLHGALPEFARNIRRSRELKKAAVIAAGPQADRTMVVTTAVECGEDYHLVHVYACPPAVLNDGCPVEKEITELRPTKWFRLENVVRQFLAGDGVDQLLVAACEQPVRRGFPCCQCGEETDGTSEFCSCECADRYYHE
jgi:hypothetical protein